MKNKIAFTLTSIAVATLLTSCSHTPTQGDKMMAVSNHAKMLSDQWNEGTQLTLNGQAKQKKGRSVANEGAEMVAKGQNMISKGNDMANEGAQQTARGAQLKQQSQNSFSEQYEDKALS